MIPVQHVLPESLAFILKKAPLSPEKVQFAWRTAVGAAVDRASEVTLGPDGILFVVARDPAWRREIVRSDHTILPRLQSLLGDDVVRRIQVKASSRKG